LFWQDKQPEKPKKVGLLVNVRRNMLGFVIWMVRVGVLQVLLPTFIAFWCRTDGRLESGISLGCKPLIKRWGKPVDKGACSTTLFMLA